MNNTKHEWQHGYRCHGYYIDEKQWGLITLTPNVYGFQSEYRFTLYAPHLRYNSYKCANLKQGKKIVEAVIKEYLETEKILFDLSPYEVQT